MRVLVCGGRDWKDRGFVFRHLTLRHTATPFSIVIEGECPYGGVDRYAQQWAEANGVPVLPFPPEFDSTGHVLGPQRNAQMLREGKPDLVLAFPGGRGTANMVKQARAAGVKVEEISPG